MAGGGKQLIWLPFLVGDDGASQTYVSSKVKGCEQTGMKSSLFRFPAETSEQEILDKIDALNNDHDIDGFIVQLPCRNILMNLRLPCGHRSGQRCGWLSSGKCRTIQLGLPAFVSATPMGIMTMLERYQIETSGKHCVVIGRSNIVGTPMSILLSRNTNPGNCTVTLCHSRTPDIAAVLPVKLISL